MNRDEAFRKAFRKARITDTDRVLAHLTASPNEFVADLYGKTRTMVHSRIADLRHRGYAIEMKRFGKGDYRYRLLVVYRVGITSGNSTSGTGWYGTSGSLVLVSAP